MNLVVRAGRILWRRKVTLSMAALLAVFAQSLWTLPDEKPIPNTVLGIWVTILFLSTLEES